MIKTQQEREDKLNNRINKLCDALDIIGELESGDSRELKNAIRKEIDVAESELDKFYPQND